MWREEKRGKEKEGERRGKERTGYKTKEMAGYQNDSGTLALSVSTLFRCSSTHTHVSHTPYVCKVTWGHTITNRTPHPSCSQTFARSARGSLLWLNMIIALSSVCLICHAADCTESEGSLKTRTRGGENERETRGLRKERNKWDGGGGDGGETERKRALEEGAGFREKEQIKK